MTVSSRWQAVLLGALLGLSIGIAPGWADEGENEDSLIDQYNTMIRDYRFGDAQNLLQKGMQSYPANPLFPLQLVSLQANIRAYIDLQQKIVDAERLNNPGRALRAARRILEVKPEQKGAQDAVDALGGKVSVDLQERLLSARALLERGNIEKARDDLDALLSIDPSDSEVRTLLHDIEAKGEVLALARQEEVAERLARLESWAVDRKRSTPPLGEEVRKFNAAVAKGLEQKPGDPHLLAQARRGQYLLRSTQIATADKSNQKNLQETVRSHTEGPEQMFERGRTLLGQGQFGEAEQLFSQLARVGNLRQIPQAYLYQGIARLATLSASDVQGARQQRLRAVSSFQNALRFDATSQLPAGYQKYAQDLAEARQTF